MKILVLASTLAASLFSISTALAYDYTRLFAPELVAQAESDCCDRGYMTSVYEVHDFGDKDVAMAELSIDKDLTATTDQRHRRSSTGLATALPGRTMYASTGMRTSRMCRAPPW